MMRLKIDPLMGQPELAANIAPVKIDGAGCHAHHVGDLPGGFCPEISLPMTPFI
jgi:hypothetical protein